MKETTIIMGSDGIEYIVSGGILIEKCKHRTKTDKSSGTERWEVCHDCGKTLIYSKNTKSKSDSQVFYEMHGRNPSGRELAAMM